MVTHLLCDTTLSRLSSGIKVSGTLILVISRISWTSSSGGTLVLVASLWLTVIVLPVIAVVHFRLIDLNY